jgi:hypothetical protein
MPTLQFKLNISFLALVEAFGTLVLLVLMMIAREVGISLLYILNKPRLF